MPNRSKGAGPVRRRADAWAVVALGAVFVMGCSSGSDPTDRDAAPAAATTTVTSTATTAPSTSTSTSTVAATSPPPVVTTPALIPPSVIASAAPTDYDGGGDPETYSPPAPCTDCGQPTTPNTPAQPVSPPPSPLDSRGFPLGTTCGPVSCTAPDGVIFVNPDAVPNLGRNLDLCDYTYCPPPGLQLRPDQLPSTGSSGGTTSGGTVSPR